MNEGIDHAMAEALGKQPALDEIDNKANTYPTPIPVRNNVTSSLTLYRKRGIHVLHRSNIRHWRYPPPVRNSTKFKLSTRMIYLRTVEFMRSTTQSMTCNKLDIQMYRF
jgi:hypothetical protein